MSSFFADSSPATVQSILQSCGEERFGAYTTGSIVSSGGKLKFAREAKGHDVDGPVAKWCRVIEAWLYVVLMHLLCIMCVLVFVSSHL